MKNLTFSCHQQGVATLVMSVVLLGTMTVLGFMTAQTAITEQKVVANEYRATQAFEAAEAGLQYGSALLESDSARLVLDANSDGYIDAATGSDINDAALQNGAKYTVSYRNVTPGDFSLLEITSVGKSIDGTVLRTIKELYVNRTYISSSPVNSLTAKGTVDLSGNLTITNANTKRTIWAGGAVSLSGSASTDAGGGDGSDSGGLNPDVTANDAFLSSMTNDAFFEAFMGGDKTTLKSKADIKLSGSGLTNYSSTLNGKKGVSIWIDQSSGDAMLSGGVIGSEEQPVILIVNGNLKFVGNNTIYGLVYVTQDWNNAGAGTIEINGAVVIEGNVSATGTPDINYSPLVNTNLQQKVGTHVKIPGSWADL